MEIKFAPGFEKSLKKCFSNNPWYLIPRTLSDMKWGIKKAYQRVVYGYDESFWWDFHSHHTDLMLGNLKKLKEKSHGYPAKFENEQEWQVLLQQMIDGFEAAKRMDGEFEYKSEDEEIFKKGMQVFTDYYFNLWD